MTRNCILKRGLKEKGVIYCVTMIQSNKLILVQDIGLNTEDTGL